MSFIVIWLHFFLQAEKSALRAATQKLLTADNADNTDLHGSKKFKQNHFDS
jgi:hypothetical protein